LLGLFKQVFRTGHIISLQLIADLSVGLT
jgi:hypothetical protein